MVEEAPTELPVEDKFGVPHAQTVSDSLYLWILVPGLLAFLAVGKWTRLLLREPFEGCLGLF
jgi:hypothetical protein